MKSVSSEIQPGLTFHNCDCTAVYTFHFGRAGEGLLSGDRAAETTCMEGGVSRQQQSMATRLMSSLSSYEEEGCWRLSPSSVSLSRSHRNDLDNTNDPWH
ncbi:hypothetical protein PGTUg99_025270 [Puccinia graminis f. sp. tritici]|uniref:Uncharacterized protein n=1 Tax=Puccinia graminis f. sp. tritici TaxID=56615 RepID=A0A5B0Q830_PUCGR|nr:hypothetical protein PGTUg99_025270 [Puccinia graminis f. sp. tritici]